MSDPRPYAGVDNGITGAVALIRPGGIVMLFLMPTMKVGKDTMIDEIALQTLLIDARHVVYEQGQKQPKFGCKGNFSQGYSFGVVSAVLALSNLKRTAVNPKDWQKEMHLGVRSAEMDTKAASLEACRRLFPEVSLLASPRSKKPHDGFADALLIAEWGRRKGL